MTSAQVTIGTVWEDRSNGTRGEVIAVQENKVQLATGGVEGFRIMTAKSLRSNYRLAAMPGHQDVVIGRLVIDEKASKEVGTLVGDVVLNEDAIEDEEREQELQAGVAEGEAETREAQQSALESVKADEEAGKKARATVGRVSLADGTIIAGSNFIIQVCGKTRDETYKVDSPIRWLLKPAGQELLKEKGATIVYGEKVTR